MEQNWRISHIISHMNAPTLPWAALQQEANAHWLPKIWWCQNQNQFNELCRQHPSYIHDLYNAIYHRDPIIFSPIIVPNIVPDCLSIINFFNIYPSVCIGGPTITQLFLLNLPPDLTVPYEINDEATDDLEASTATSIQNRISLNIYFMEHKIDHIDDIMMALLHKLNDTRAGQVTKWHIYTNADQMVIKYKLSSPAVTINVHFAPYLSANHLFVNLYINALGILLQPSQNRWLISQQALTYIKTLMITLIYKKNGPGFTAYKHEIDPFRFRNVLTVAL